MIDSNSDSLISSGSTSAPASVGRRLERAGHAAEVRPLPQRHVQQHAGLAEQLLDAVDQRGEVDVVGVHAVDDDHPPQAGLLGLGEDPAGVHLDARLGVDDDGRRVDAAHGADGLADEVGIAGRVDQVEVLAGVVEVHDAGFDRVLVLLLFLVEVADARAVVDAGGPADGPGGGEDLVDQRGLAGRAVPTEGDVADLLDRNTWA